VDLPTVVSLTIEQLDHQGLFRLRYVAAQGARKPAQITLEPLGCNVVSPPQE
jgi:hypothetical protein